MLTGQEIANRQIINKFEESNIQQQGIDVRVMEIRRVIERAKDGYENQLGCIPGFIPAVKHLKTLTPQSTQIKTTTYNGCDGWILTPGYYELMFVEGCDIPADCCLQFKTRSSVIRCGGEVRSGLFDAGFKTDNMGAFLKVELPMFIEEGARVAQVIVDSSSVVENLYDGQWQGDKQRKN